jgi:hypothetical protein
LERDRLTIFWEVGKKQLEECRSEARVKDRELEQAEERHQTEVKVYKQKVKHLLYEQEHNLAELKAENMVSSGGIVSTIWQTHCKSCLTTR